MLSGMIITKVIFKGVCYYLISGALKEGFKCIKECGEAEDENKSVLVPIGKRGFKVGAYGIAGLIVKDMGHIIGVIPHADKIVTIGKEAIPVISQLFPWL